MLNSFSIKNLYPTCQYDSKLRTVRRTKAAFVQLFQVCISSASSSYPTSFIAQVVQQHLAPKSSPPHYIGFALAYWNQLSLVIQAWGHKTEHHCQPFSYQETFYSLLKIDFLWSLELFWYFSGLSKLLAKGQMGKSARFWMFKDTFKLSELCSILILILISKWEGN